MRLHPDDIHALAKEVTTQLVESTEFQDKLMDRFLDRLYLQTGKSLWRKVWSAIFVALAVVIAAVSGVRLELPEWVKALFR